MLFFAGERGFVDVFLEFMWEKGRWHVEDAEVRGRQIQEKRRRRDRVDIRTFEKT
jgi:hypothetical protein